MNYVLKGNVRLVIFISNDIANAKFLNGKFLSYFFGKDSPASYCLILALFCAKQESYLARLQFADHQNTRRRRNSRSCIAFAS